MRIEVVPVPVSCAGREINRLFVEIVQAQAVVTGAVLTALFLRSLGCVVVPRDQSGANESDWDGQHPSPGANGGECTGERINAIGIQSESLIWLRTVEVRC